MSALLAISILSLGAGSPALAGEDRDNGPHIFPPHSHPYGQSYGAWGAEWWKWVYSFPAAKNPIQDTTGEFGSLNQSGPVWFLAGTFGETAKRTLTIPGGKGIFFPIFNTFYDYPCPEPPPFQPAQGQSLEDFLAALAAAYIDYATALAVQVDGVELQHPFNYRAASHLVTFTADPSWVTLDPCVTGTPQSGVSDGYWVMLAPLPKGEHTIHISAAAAVPGYPFNLDVTYHLTVLPEDLGNHDIAPPNSEPYGKTYSEWSARWWQWVYSIPVAENPVTDPTGQYAGEGQSGPVWFLAGNFGGTTVRDVSVPEGKSLFFPVLNQNWVEFPDDPPYTIPELRAIIRPYMDNATLACAIDGKAVKNLSFYREDSVVFTTTVPDGNLLGLPAGHYAPCVDNGYYLMLDPLKPGQHTIHFTGINSDASFALDVTYHLTVARGHRGHDGH